MIELDGTFLGHCENLHAQSTGTIYFVFDSGYGSFVEGSNVTLMSPHFHRSSLVTIPPISRRTAQRSINMIVTATAQRLSTTESRLQLSITALSLAAKAQSSRSYSLQNISILLRRTFTLTLSTDLALRLHTFVKTPSTPDMVAVKIGAAIAPFQFRLPHLQHSHFDMMIAAL